MAVEELPVGHVLVVGVRGPGVSRRGELDVGHIEAGQNLHHPGDGLRLRRVHGLNEAVGDGGVTDPRNQGGGVAEVLHILGPARGLFVGVHPGDALADAFAHTRASFSYIRNEKIGIFSLLSRKNGLGCSIRKDAEPFFIPNSELPIEGSGLLC